MKKAQVSKDMKKYKDFYKENVVRILRDHVHM